MRDAYFAPERVKREGGIDPLFRGAVRQAAQEIDLKVCKCKETLSLLWAHWDRGSQQPTDILMLRRIFFRANLEYNFMGANSVSSFSSKQHVCFKVALFFIN